MSFRGKRELLMQVAPRYSSYTHPRASTRPGLVTKEDETRMAGARWDKHPAIGPREPASRWLEMQANLRLAPNTIDAHH
jgi:hypothetical protein